MPSGPVFLPELAIPASKNVVKVSIIDSTTRLTGLSAHRFMTPELPGFDKFSGPSYSFLVEHTPTNKRVLFDLGVRKDPENLPPAVRKLFEKSSMRVTIDKNVIEILSENGVDPGSIEAIILSHRHFDHVGDPSTFPASTSLTVGPRFKEVVGPGYPHKEDSTVAASAWEGRDLIELDFTTDDRRTKVGKYRAVDYFGDGSFYLLQTPGHTVDHMCGFARVKTDGAGNGEFILMGGDCAHHCGEYRPSPYLPIPENIEPDPRLDPWHGGCCPGEIFARLNAGHEGDAKWNKPFFQPTKSVPDDLPGAIWSLGVLEEFDAQSNVIVIFAHDESMMGILEYFPKPATDWKQKGWKREGHWRFMNELRIRTDAKAKSNF